MSARSSAEVERSPQVVCGGADDESCDVVLRRSPRKTAESSVLSYLERERRDGEKRVKWSPSTEVREKMKECRRSQLDMALDYHHIAEEERREREGVKQWRNSITLPVPESAEGETSPDSTAGRRPSETHPGPAQSNNGDENGEDDSDDSSDGYSDEFDPCGNESLERKLRVINAATTRYTLLPAYTAAVKIYEPWLASTENTQDLADGTLSGMRSQCDLYKRVLDLYSQWGVGEKEEEDEVVDQRFDNITELLQQAKGIGEPPQCVVDAIASVLTNEANVKKQLDMYNKMVDEMVTAFGATLEV
ncbi:uncharacterized protein LOC106012178, partial [Aplysia californica]|uniref:Peroxin-19 n=1 Tax=Aplysia californica TaxID=6500 RepID=A0ABM1A2W8_APLCA